MSFRGRQGTVSIAILIAPVLFAALVPLQSRIDARASAIEPQKTELLFQSGKLLKKLSLGYDALLADIYWTRVVQYYGAELDAKKSHFELLEPLLNLATTLDPRLLVAYKFGAIMLSEPSPVGAGRPDLAVNLVRRGVAANPDDYWLQADLGFLYYWHLKDYQQAAQVYLDGSKVPGAPVWLKWMAARVAEQGGARETSRLIWGQVYESTQDRYIRETAERHLEALRAQEDLEQLGKLAVEFRQRYGHFPASMQDFLNVGMLPGIPMDPKGYAYEMDPGGEARLNRASPIDLRILKPPFQH